ncbi:MAG: flagellar biosynthesis protein FlgD [Planctomycetes bacterium]|nr:flagellar biosynthesis protein FlgD [Planctomycetota bacterium]
MSVSPVSNLDTAYLSSDTALGGSSTTLDKDAFTKMLVAQMQNQDPMAPQDNQAMVAQLAQFSSLEQMQNLNQNILGLAVLQQTNAVMSQLTQSSALIGQNVNYIDPDTNAEATGTVNKVKILDGIATLEINGHDVPLGNVTEILGNIDTGGGGGSDTGSGNS